jgi:hypothetical protein
MPVQLPYLASNRNVAELFEKITSAKIPDKFSHSFLQTTLGLKSTNDRALIPLLRNLGFLDQSGTPRHFDATADLSRFSRLFCTLHRQRTHGGAPAGVV